MKASRASSLAVRIVLVTIAVGILMSGIGVGIKIAQFEEKLFSAAEREASTLAQSIALTAESVSDVETLRRYVLMIGANPHVTDIYVVEGEHHQIVASSKYRLIGKSVDVIAIQSEREGLIHAIEHRDIHFNVHKEKLAYEAIVPAQIPSEGSAGRNHDAAVMVDMDYRHIKEAHQRDLIQQIIIFIGMALCTALAASIFIIVRVIRPLNRLKFRITEEANLIEAGHSAPPEKEDEIQSLVRFHELYSRALDEKQRALANALIEAKKLAQIAERTSNGVVICDAEGKTEWVNPGFTNITGYELEEVIGKKPGDLHQGDETNPDTIREIHDAIEHGKAIKTDVLNYNKEGTQSYWVRLDIEPLFDSECKLTNYIAIQTDVSLDKEREAAIVAAKEAAESLAQAKTDFLSMTSHELRTPMNGIMGMLELLKSSGLNSEQSDFVDAATKCSDNLLRIINDILDYTHLESNNLNREPTEFDLRKEVQYAHGLSNEAAQAKGLEYTYEVEDGVPQTVFGEPEKLVRLINILTANAIKFTNEGSVTLFVRSFGKDDGSQQVVFEVCDTGIGMDESKVRVLLTPFTQAETSFTRGFGGMGLGLAICKQICDGLGSKIEVCSKPGEGSSFKFVLDWPQKKTERVAS